ncbi:MAG: hypothetical protein IKD89_06370 [Clostridia bacterium]|nr:hypothetical protein [Clostridia bacterium]
MNRPLMLILPAVLCLSLIWALFPVSGGAPSSPDTRRVYESAPSESVVSVSSDADASAAYQTAVIRDGRLCLIWPETGEVARVLDVNVRTLPPADREMFASGVALYSKEEAARFAEDYTS